jgi:hypothetical protein
VRVTTAEHLRQLRSVLVAPCHRPAVPPDQIDQKIDQID